MWGGTAAYLKGCKWSTASDPQTQHRREGATVVFHMAALPLTLLTGTRLGKCPCVVLPGPSLRLCMYRSLARMPPHPLSTVTGPSRAHELSRVSWHPSL